jgi:DNA-binding PadR family transcriptional regulator
VLSYAILSVLVSEPCSGYDLAKRFDKSVEGSIGFFWNATYQQIYRELAKLEEKNWIAAEIVHQEHRPAKRLYELTERGREHLREWIGESESAAPIKDELLVKLFAGYLVGEEMIVAKLERHAHQHQQRLKIYEAIERQYFAEPESGTAIALSDPTLWHPLRAGLAEVVRRSAGIFASRSLLRILL